MRIVFLGTPSFAVPALKALAARHEIVAAISQPDRPGNRGVIQPTPVKTCAAASGIPVYQFEKISRDGVDILKSLTPDAMVTAAYGQLLSRSVLDIPKYGTFNVHGSLLPKYRGSSPVQWAIINGEKETGVTIMKTEEGLDCGDILLKKEILITEKDDAITMFEKLSVLGADMIVEALALIECGKAEFEKQHESEATYFPMLRKTDGLIAWEGSAESIFNKVRGMISWPTAYTFYKGKTVKIFKCRPVTGAGKSGEVIGAGKELIVACGNGALHIDELQLEGKRRMSAQDFINGTRIAAGELLG